jgi:hypothetical protein
MIKRNLPLMITLGCLSWVSLLSDAVSGLCVYTCHLQHPDR